MTCSLNGAARVHKTLLSVLHDAGIEAELNDVYCLSQCSVGPSLRCDDMIWVTRGRDAVVEARGWRDAEGTSSVAIDEVAD